jgi:hypothetical protein
VLGAGLAGSTSGTAVVVYTVANGNGEEVLARRLTNGKPGAGAQVNPAGTTALFAPVGVLSPFVRGRLMAMDASGGAAICYVVRMQQTIATLAPGKNSWVNHDAQSSCQDFAMDNSGDVVSISLSNNMITATRIVGGQVANDTFGANLMDEPALAVSPTGMAIVVARDTNFHVVGFENKNIAVGGTWSSLGRIDSNNVFDPGDSPEEPLPALDKNGVSRHHGRERCAAGRRNYDEDHRRRDGQQRRERVRDATQTRHQQLRRTAHSHPPVRARDAHCRTLGARPHLPRLPDGPKASSPNRKSMTRCCHPRAPTTGARNCHGPSSSRNSRTARTPC